MGTALSVNPGSGSEVYIKPATGSAKQISEMEQLYTTDTSLSVTSGVATFSSEFIDGTIDKSSEMAYRERLADGEKIEFSRGRLWVESKWTIQLVMKNMDATVKEGNIVLLEQPNQIFSTLYALKWDITIVAWGMTHVLKAWKKIMISKSDLANPGTTLEMLSGDIDDSIQQNPLFILKNGSSLLTSLALNPSDSQSLSGSKTISGALIGTPNWSNYISITTPLDGASITTASVDIAGKILSKEVKRVTLNDTDAIVSPVDESFMLKGIPITNSIMNIVYKAYAQDATLLEKWVLTIYGKNVQSWTDKLTPTNFPINDKDYRITSPAENPYITTDTSVTVNGTVPKNTVKYIMVNNYRLKKFVAYSTAWYYYANMDYDTMKEGINLYEISFYWSNDEVLYKQLFTIVKEKKNTVSGELIR